MRRALFILALAVVVVAAGPVGSASAVLTGVQLVGAVSASSSSAKSITATCPAGKKVISAGGATLGEAGRVLLDVIRPNAALTSVTIHAREDEAATAGNWVVVASAVCASAPSGLERIAATSVADSTNKGVTATCPTGKRLLGTGGEITSANGQVLFDGLLPGSGLSAVTANALEDETGIAGNWSVTAYAICSNPVLGLQRVVATGGSDSSLSKHVDAACPVGKQLIGTGGTINSPNGQVVLTGLAPNGAFTDAEIFATEDANGNSANWSLTAVAICAASADFDAITATESFAGMGSLSVVNSCGEGRLPVGLGGEVDRGRGRVGLAVFQPFADAPQRWVVAATYQSSSSDPWSLTAQRICATPFAGQQVVTVTSPSDAQTPKSVTATCPSGKKVLGAGATFSVTQRLLQAMRPDATLTSVTAIAQVDETAPSGDWALSAHAVCASPPPGLQRVATSSTPASEEFSQATATCPAGKHLIGTGGEINNGPGQVLLDDLRADAALTKTTVAGFEDVTGFDGAWNVTAYSICINR